MKIARTVTGIICYSEPSDWEFYSIKIWMLNVCRIHYVIISL